MVTKHYIVYRVYISKANHGTIDDILKSIWLIKIHNFCTNVNTQGRAGVTFAPACVQGFLFNSELQNVSDIWKLNIVITMHKIIIWLYISSRNIYSIPIHSYENVYSSECIDSAAKVDSTRWFVITKYYVEYRVDISTGKSRYNGRYSEIDLAN